MATSNFVRLLRQLDAWQPFPAAMLVYVDLRQMREVNLWAEPDAGDRLIARALASLRSWAGPQNVAVKLWSNEFVAAKAIDHGQSAVEEAQALRERLCAIRYDSVLGESSLNVSIGFVTVRADTHEWRDCIDQAADACAQAKRRGLNQIVSGAQHHRDGTRSRNDPAAVRNFRRLRDAGRLTLHMQPVMDIRGDTPRLAKAEFLLRMLRDDGSHSPLPPGTIETIEHFGLNAELDAFSSQFVLGWVDEHRDALERLDGVTMNLSAKSLVDAHFMAKLYADVRALHPPAGKLAFEITETAAVEHLEVAAEIVEDFREIGCGFSLDDFGSGLCSFGYLHSLPVSEVKIDGRFVRDIVDNPLSQEIVRAIRQVARAAGKRTVAEFVDEPRKLAMLQRLDVDYAQGLLFNPALPPEQLLRLIESAPKLRLAVTA